MNQFDTKRKSKKKTINDLVQTKAFATWLALLSMLIQSKHTFQAYLSTEATNPNWIDIAFSAGAAGVLDLIILFYTLRGRIGVAKLGAGILMTVNIYAYWIIHEAFTREFIFSGVFAISLPLLVYYYSDELVHKKTKNSRNKKQGEK